MQEFQGVRVLRLTCDPTPYTLVGYDLVNKSWNPLTGRVFGGVSAFQGFGCWVRSPTGSWKNALFAEARLAFRK